VSKLSADHSGIGSAPQVVTHRSPDVVVAEFNSAPGGSSSSKPDLSLGTDCDIEKNTYPIIVTTT